MGNHVGCDANMQKVVTAMSDIKLELRNLVKVFSNRPEPALTLLNQGLSKAEVQQRTGLSIGLAGVSAHFKKGEISCVMGLSGSGKSTLIRHINRLIDPTSGEVLLDGQNLLALDLEQLRQVRRHQISMVFQSFALLPQLTVFDNVAFGLQVRGEDKAQTREQVMHWLATVGLEKEAQRYPDELSGGMRQRVGLARALATDAEVLLMDEAFSALDPLTRYELQTQLQQLQANLGKTIIFVTHDVQEAFRLGHHILMLRDGQVEQAGTPQGLLDTPASDYVAQFVQRAQLPT